jgi:hypothetical protein
VTEPACDACWNGRHFACRGCGCSVCISGRAPKPKVKKRRAPKVAKLAKPRAPRASVRRHPAGHKPVAKRPLILADHQREAICFLRSNGSTVAEIVTALDVPRSQVNDELRRSASGSITLPPRITYTLPVH